jgi:hypothetical protein
MLSTTLRSVIAGAIFLLALGVGYVGWHRASRSTARITATMHTETEPTCCFGMCYWSRRLTRYRRMEMFCAARSGAAYRVCTKLLDRAEQTCDGFPWCSRRAESF